MLIFTVRIKVGPHANRITWIETTCSSELLIGGKINSFSILNLKLIVSNTNNVLIIVIANDVKQDKILNGKIVKYIYVFVRFIGPESRSNNSNYEYTPTFRNDSSKNQI